MGETVAMNEFATRHTADSDFSYYTGSFEDLCELVQENLGERVALSPDGGVSKVSLPGDGFFAGVTQINEETPLKAIFQARQEEESPHISFRALGGKKAPAVAVDIILYSHENLAIKDEHSTDADWEIISINAKPYHGEEPPHPVTMARNFLDLPGGTAKDYTAEEFAESILHWLGGGANAPYVMLEQEK